MALDTRIGQQVEQWLQQHVHQCQYHCQCQRRDPLLHLPRRARRVVGVRRDDEDALPQRREGERRRARAAAPPSIASGAARRKLAGATVWSVRYDLSDGRLTMAKPCACCTAAMRAARVPRDARVYKLALGECSAARAGEVRFVTAPRRRRVVAVALRRRPPSRRCCRCRRKGS